MGTDSDGIQYLRTGADTHLGWVQVRVPTGGGPAVLRGRGVATGKRRQEEVEWAVPWDAEDVAASPPPGKLTVQDGILIAHAVRSARSS
jgi:hypothetical protein